MSRHLILVVVDDAGMRAWTRLKLTDPIGTRHALFSDLETILAATPQHPALILAPLFAGSFDATDVAKVLQKVGYAGALYARVQGVPDIGLIRREIAVIAPGIVFDVLSDDGLDWLRRVSLSVSRR